MNDYRPAKGFRQIGRCSIRKIYLDVFADTIPAVLAQGGVAPADVKGIAIDFTASSPMPHQSRWYATLLPG